MSESNKMLMKYITGFVLSLLLTLAAYAVATNHTLGLGMDTVLLSLGGLATIQLGVQLIFFLHLSEEARPRLKLLSFSFMASVLFIIVAGSIWIMYHLNYNMMDMTADEKDAYMTTQKDKGF